MTLEVVSWLMVCIPVVLTLAAWANLYFTRRSVRLGTFAWLTLAVVTANAAWASWNFTYVLLKPSTLPAWNDVHVST